MNFRIMLLLIIAHLLGDFTLQNKYIVKLRFEKIIKGNALHALIHLMLMLVMLISFKFLKLIEVSFIYTMFISIIISITHFGVDFFKTILIKKRKCFRSNILIFLLDQLLHFVFICLLSSRFKQLYIGDITVIDKYLIIIAVVITCTFAAGVFVKQFTTYLNLKDYKNLINKNFVFYGLSGEETLNNGGFTIGILERSFILLVIAIGQPSMVAFVLTAKSIARFKKLDDSQFAEYFMIGTFLSFIIAIFGGILIYSLKTIPIIK